MGAFLNQPSMAAGEIAPDLYGRVDQELYYIGLRKARNFIIRQYGGSSNRMGTYFTAEAKDNSHKTRLIPFQFNDQQTYALEFGHNYMRVIKGGAEVLESATVKNITGITKANPAVVTSAAHGFSNGNDVYITGVLGMTEINQRSYRVANVTANTFELNDYSGGTINSTAYGTYASGGTATRIYTVVTPWPESALFDLNYAQNKDVLTVCHPSYAVRDITRTAHDAWTVSLFNNTNGPFKDINVTATTVYANAVSGAVTLTASAALFTANDVGTLFYVKQNPTDTTKSWEVGKAVIIGDIRRSDFNYYQAQNAATTGTIKPTHLEGTQTDGDNGVQWLYLHSGFGIVSITGFTSTTIVTGTVVSRLPDNVNGIGGATDNWAKAAWSTDEGYPAAAAYHKQRLIFGGSLNAPNRLWMSEQGARVFFGQSNPILDDEAITLDLDTTQVNAVRHLLPLAELIVLTSASEQMVNGPNDALQATSLPIAKVQGYTGSSKVPPIIIGNTAIYVQEMGSVVRSLQFELATDTFTGIDLSARAPHLFRNKQVVDWSYQMQPFSVVWAIMSDGALNGFTFMQEQKVYAWHRHDTDGVYESCCSIREGNETATYFVIKRTINGVTKRYIERFASRYFSTIRDAYFVDCGLSYDGRNTTATTVTVTGGTTWDSPEVLTLTASSSIFTSADLGNQIVFRTTNANGVEIALRLTITAFTSGTVVSAIPTKALPVAYQGVARTDWEFARKTFANFNHLEAKSVSCFSDGNVVEGLSVSNGKVVLTDPGAVVHIGLKYTSDFETLDMAQPQGQTKAKTLNVPRVFLTVQETRNVWAATNAFDADDGTKTKQQLGFMQYKDRSPSIGYDAAIPAATGLIEIGLATSWSNKGRFCVRNDDPTPITINCVTPEVVLGFS